MARRWRPRAANQGQGPSPKEIPPTRRGRSARDMGSCLLRPATGSAGYRAARSCGRRGAPRGLGPSPWETPRKRQGRSARAPAGWSLPRGSDSVACRAPRGARSGLRPSSGETRTKTQGRSARAPGRPLGCPLRRAGPSDGCRVARSWHPRGAHLVCGPSSGQTPSKRSGRSARAPRCPGGWPLPPTGGSAGCRVARSPGPWVNPGKILAQHLAGSALGLMLPAWDGPRDPEAWGRLEDSWGPQEGSRGLLLMPGATLCKTWGNSAMDRWCPKDWLLTASGVWEACWATSSWGPRTTP